MDIGWRKAFRLFAVASVPGCLMRLCGAVNPVRVNQTIHPKYRVFHPCYRRDKVAMLKICIYASRTNTAIRIGTMPQLEFLPRL